MKLQNVTRTALPALLALPVVLAIAAPAAQAQELRIAIGKHGRHGSVSGEIVIGGRHGYERGAERCDPRIVVRAPAPRPEPVWIPGHYENVERRVYVPGEIRREYVPPRYEERRYRDYRGQCHVERILVCDGYWRTVQDPGHWRCVTERVWVEGSWRKHPC